MLPATARTNRVAKTWSVHACGAGIVLIAVVAFHQGIYAPCQRDAEARVARINQLQKLIATGDAVVEQHRQLSDRLTALRNSVAAAKARMPVRVVPSQFIEQLTKTAAELQLEVVQCGATAPEVFDDHSRVEVTCTLSGSYASICRCLAAIDQFHQLSKVSRLEIESGPNSLAYPAQITFQLYYRHEAHDKDIKRGAS